MTNQQYFISQLGFTPGADFVTAALIDASITGSDTYDGSNMIDIKKAVIRGLNLLLSTADITQGYGETQFTTKYDRGSILKRIAMLEAEIGETVGLPIIRGVSVW